MSEEGCASSSAFMPEVQCPLELLKDCHRLDKSKGVRVELEELLKLVAVSYSIL